MVWNYRDQGIYLLSDTLLIAILVIATLAPFIARNAIWGRGLLIGVTALGTAALQIFGSVISS
jgi:hypothetical protein